MVDIIHHDYAFLLPALTMGGKEKTTLRLVNSLVAQGKNIQLILHHAVGPLLAEVHSSIPVYNLQAVRARNTLLPLVRYFRIHRPRVFLVDDFEMLLITRIAQRITQVKIPVIMIQHLIRSQAQCALIPKSLLRFIAPLAAHIIAVSEAAKNDMVGSGISDTKITVIYNPITHDGIASAAQETPSHPWFHQLHDENIPLIIGVGRLEKNKAYDQLISAFATLLTQRKARLMILGDGREKAALTAWVQQLGITSHVVLPGFVDNPYAYLARAACLVHCAESESFGNVIVEALAVGCPVVTLEAQGGMQEILANGMYGKMVARNHPQLLADAINDTIDAPPSRDFLMARAQDFSVKKITAQYLRMCESIAS